MKRNPILLTTLVWMICLAAGIVCAEPDNVSSYQDIMPVTGSDAGSDAGSAISLLLSLAEHLGMDLSYGNGTVFSMVDQSLTGIIRDLSTGNPEGFADNPLILETLNYFGINPETVIVSPDDVPEPMDSIDGYHQRYPEPNLTSAPDETGLFLPRDP